MKAIRHKQLNKLEETELIDCCVLAGHDLQELVTAEIFICVSPSNSVDFFQPSTNFVY